jgi:anti-sigma factor RsiW
MKCKQFKKHLSAYADGQVEQPLAKQIEFHLQSCDECQAKVEQFRQTWEWLDNEITIQPNPFFSAKVQRRIRELENSSMRKIHWLSKFERFLIPATVAAGLAVGFFLGTQLMSQITVGESYASATAEIIDSSVEVFSELPEGSLAAAYDELGLLNNGS